jgi:hypothetical protein
MASPTHISAPTQITIRPPGQFFEGESAGIGDVIDTINPLQHIPFVSTLYREFTGDTAGAGSSLLGGALFGGVFGFIAGLADVIFESATGKSMGGAVMAALRGETSDPNLQYAASEVNLGDFAGDVSRSVRRPLSTTAATTEFAAVLPEPESIGTLTAATAQDSRDQQILSLFGEGVAQAHAAYSHASMRDVLQNTSTNLVL